MTDEQKTSEESKSYGDYNDLLDKARDNIPEKISEHERFEIPDLDIMREGNTTIFKNFSDIADKINRPPEKFLKFLLGELGTAGEKENGRVVFKGKIGSNKIERKVKDYVQKYVLCPECDRPDTRLVKEDRIEIIKCDACGARGPIRGKQSKSKSTGKTKGIKEGKVYELMIQDIGKEGDGMAKKEGYTIYVPGTTKGDKVKVKITNTTGNLAFGRVVD